MSSTHGSLSPSVSSMLDWASLPYFVYYELDRHLKKGVKKVRSPIKLYSYYFDYTASTDTNVT